MALGNQLEGGSSIFKSKKFWVIIIFVVADLIVTDFNYFFKDSKYTPIGFEAMEHPMQSYVFSLTCYINALLLSVIVLLYIPKKDLALFILSIANVFWWANEVLDFILFGNNGWLNIKDYIFLIVFIVSLVYGVKTYKRKKGSSEEIINVTNLALLKWFIPKKDADQALKNSQRNIELEQKLLRSQMNPHFIFNSLTSVQNYIYSSNKDTAASYLAKFAKLMRLILENSRNEFIVFSKEIETLELYLELQKIRFDNKFEYVVYVDPLIDQEELSIPPMFAQPFIENALEHGLLHKNAHGIIEVKFILKKDCILFEVQDNGIGKQQAANINQEQKPEHTSYATTITQERLALIYNKDNGHEAVCIEDVLDVNNEVIGTKASFDIPYSYV